MSRSSGRRRSPLRRFARTRLDDLTKRYADRHGVRVPELTPAAVARFGRQHLSDPTLNLWLIAAIAAAQDARPDLDPDEFARLFAFCAARDPALELDPQPIEILTQIAALRPPLARWDQPHSRQVAHMSVVKAPALTDRSYPSFDEIEAARRRLAESGKPHGYDALGGRGPDHPFPGQRSTIRRRYGGRTPPGSWIRGVCDQAPPHQHYEARAPGTP